jgi:hypothetical protein
VPVLAGEHPSHERIHPFVPAGSDVFPQPAVGWDEDLDAVADDALDLFLVPHEYRLTQKGLDLYPVLLAIRDWGDHYMAPEGPPVQYRHRDCGGEAHTHLTCDRCGSELTARDVEPELGPGMEPYISGARSLPTGAE